MNRILVNYDLYRPGQDYTDLINAIKAQGQAWHILLSTWALLTTKSCAQVRDALNPYLDTNDKLVVVRIDDWATAGISGASTMLG